MLACWSLIALSQTVYDRRESDHMGHTKKEREAARKLAELGGSNPDMQGIPRRRPCVDSLKQKTLVPTDIDTMGADEIRSETLPFHFILLTASYQDLKRRFSPLRI